MRPVQSPLPVPESVTALSQERGHAINEIAWEYWSSTDQRGYAVAYLRLERGIDIRHLESLVGTVVGHAGLGWADLTSHLLDRGVEPDELLAMDLVRRSTAGHLTDTFRGRLMVPVRSQAGRITGFIGRAEVEGARAAKYRNPTRTATFQKSEALYSPTHVASAATVVVVEGPLDALAVAAAAAAAGRLTEFWPCTASGVSVSPAQARRVITSGVADVVIALDGDSAGADGTLRWIDAVGRERRQPVMVTRLPYGRDPADWLAEKGPAGLAAFDPTTQSNALRPVEVGRELRAELVAEAEARRAVAAGSRAVVAPPRRHLEPPLARHSAQPSVMPAPRL